MSIKISNFIKDLLQTSATQIIAMFFGIFLIRIFAEYLSKDLFGVFMIVKRIVSIGLIAITLNIEIGLARYVSHFKKKSEEYFKFSAFLVVLSGSLMIALSIIFKKNLSIYFFKSEDLYFLIPIIAITILITSFISILYAFFRGKQNMSLANWIQILTNFSPILVALTLIFYFNYSGEKIMSFFFLISSLFNLIIFIYYSFSIIENYRFDGILKKIN